MKQCAASQSKDAPFTGTWTRTDENSIAGTSESDTVDVVTDGKKFRVSSKRVDDMGGVWSSVVVYDGENIHEKGDYTPPPNAPADLYRNDEPPQTHTRKPLTGEILTMAFWKDSLEADANAGPGGSIAGRPTVLYQGRWNRPDGEMTGQVWMDSETNTVLKKVAGVYSKQIESAVFKSSIECTRFQPGPVDAAQFNKP